MHVIDMIFFWAKARPHHPAIIQSDSVITYKGLADGIRAISKRIAEFDLDADEPVGVSIENPAYQLLVTFALLRSGLMAAPVYRKLLPFLRPAGIKNVIYTTEGLVQSGGRNIRFDNGWLGNTSETDAVSDHGRTIAYPNLIFFSSGTTGMPKKNAYTPDALLERMSTIVIRESDDISRALIMPGVSSSFGFNRACELFYGGKTACFAPSEESSLVLINTYRIDGIFASPQQVRGLMAAVRRGAQYPLDSLKSVRIGGGFASKNYIRYVMATFCTKVTMVYGSTEAGVLTSADVNIINLAPTAVGYLLPWVEVEAADEAGNALPAGEEGRLRCRTPVFLKNLAANNPEALKDGKKAWWYPGDVGHVTSDGLLHITGRTGDVINQGGNKVSAAVLEEALLSCAGVKDAAVCGVVGRATVELWVGVVPEPTMNVTELKQEIESNDKFSVSIDELLIVDAIPRNELGKVKRHELQQKLLSVKRPNHEAARSST